MLLAETRLEIPWSNTINIHNEVRELILIKACLNCYNNFRMKPFIFKQNAVLDQPMRVFNPQMPIIIEVKCSRNNKSN
jgi:hypothetical protein